MTSPNIFQENFLYKPMRRLKPVIWWTIAFALGVMGWFAATGMQELYKDWQFVRQVRINTERQMLQQQLQQLPQKAQ